MSGPIGATGCRVGEHSVGRAGGRVRISGPRYANFGAEAAESENAALKRDYGQSATAELEREQELTRKKTDETERLEQERLKAEEELRARAAELEQEQELARKKAKEEERVESTRSRALSAELSSKRRQRCQHRLTQ